MASRLTPMKLISFGGAMAAIAAAVGVYILAADQKGGFLQLDGWIATIAFAFGAVMALLGLVRRGEDGGQTTTMTQKAGDNSVQTQARRGHHQLRFFAIRRKTRVARCYCVGWPPGARETCRLFELPTYRSSRIDTLKSPVIGEKRVRR